MEALSLKGGQPPMTLQLVEIRSLLRRAHLSAIRGYQVALGDQYAQALGGSDGSPAGLVALCQKALADTAEPVAPPASDGAPVSETPPTLVPPALASSEPAVSADEPAAPVEVPATEALAVVEDAPVAPEPESSATPEATTTALVAPVETSSEEPVAEVATEQAEAAAEEESEEEGDGEAEQEAEGAGETEAATAKDTSKTKKSRRRRK